MLYSDKEYIMNKILKEKRVRNKTNSRSNRVNKFLEKSKLKFGNQFTLIDKSEYTVTGAKIRFKCKLHGEFITSPKNHLGSQTGACPECAKQKRKEVFFDKCKAKFGDKFDYSETEYLGIKHPITVICKKHGKFTTPANHHIEKPSGPNSPSLGGCPECAKESQSKKVTQPLSYWIDRVKVASKGTMTLVDYVGDYGIGNIAIINCPVHGEFKYSFSSISKCIGKGTKLSCPACYNENNSWGGRTKRTDIPGTLYFIYFKEIELYKLGVTSRIVKERFNLYPEYEILWTKKFNTLAEAYEEETKLFRKYNTSRYKGEENLLKLGGSTELLYKYIPYECDSQE